jgi:hypothetical protein
MGVVSIMNLPPRDFPAILAPAILAEKPCRVPTAISADAACHLGKFADSQESE